MPHSEYLRWDRDDRQAEADLKDYHAEECPHCGIHGSTWDPKHGGDIRRPDLVPEWTFCKPCKLWQTAEAAGPPGGKDAALGWSLHWVKAKYDD